MLAKKGGYKGITAQSCLPGGQEFVGDHNYQQSRDRDSSSCDRRTCFRQEDTNLPHVHPNFILIERECGLDKTKKKKKKTRKFPRCTPSGLERWSPGLPGAAAMARAAPSRSLLWACTYHSCLQRISLH